MAVQTNELAAVVLQKIQQDVPDGLARETAFMDWLAGEGKKKQNGGLYIQSPIKLIENNSSDFISGTSAVVDTTPSTQLQYQVLNWKYYNFNVNFTLADYNIARGELEVVDFMESKIDGALADAMREISLAMHGSSAAAPLQPEGLQDVVAASGTAYAGLTDTDYAADAYLPYIATDSTINYNNINKIIQNIKARMRNSKKSKKMMGLMNQSAYSRFLNSVQAQQIFTDMSIAESGFEGFKVNGVEFYLDADCPGSQDGATGDNFVYVFPVDVMKMFYNFGFGDASPFDGDVQLPNSPIMSVQSYMSFNLVCNNRRLVGVNKSMVA